MKIEPNVHSTTVTAHDKKRFHPALRSNAAPFSVSFFSNSIFDTEEEALKYAQDYLDGIQECIEIYMHSRTGLTPLF